MTERYIVTTPEGVCKVTESLDEADAFAVGEAARFVGKRIEIWAVKATVFCPAFRNPEEPDKVAAMEAAMDVQSDEPVAEPAPASPYFSRYAEQDDGA